MGDTGVGIGVRVLAENEGGDGVKVRRDKALCEALRELERALALGDAEALGDVRRVGTEDSMGVHRTETQRLSWLCRLVSGDRGS